MNIPIFTDLKIGLSIARLTLGSVTISFKDRMST